MFIQCGYAPLHIMLAASGWTTDERLLLMERLLATGAAVNQPVTGDFPEVCI